jgi:hypothetical protein
MVDNRYRVNPGSVFSLQYHPVWCPKYRKRILVNALEKRLRELLYQKAKEIKAERNSCQACHITAVSNGTRSISEYRGLRPLPVSSGGRRKSKIVLY